MESTYGSFQSQNYSLGCNSVISGFLYSDTTVHIDFNHTDAMDVVITNCPNMTWVNITVCDKSGHCSNITTFELDWDIDTTMSLKNSKGIDITNQSRNLCDGNNCWVQEICIPGHAETIVMKDLPPDQYRLELSAVDNSSDTFAVNVSCGDFSNLTSLWDAYHCDDPDPSLFDPSDTIIGCDMSISGHFTCGETKTFVFWLFEEDNVVFETCGSTFDTILYLYNASDTKVGEMIHGQSINGCDDGEDCQWTTVHNVYCDHFVYPQSEVIPMMNLPAGLYYLDISSWWTNVYGEYNLGIHCGVEMAVSFNGTLDQCNYVQLGTLQGELKKLPYPFNESIQDGAVYPVGYCYHIKGITSSFEFTSGATGRIYLQTFDGSNICLKYNHDTRSNAKRESYSNISGMAFCFCLSSVRCCCILSFGDDGMMTKQIPSIRTSLIASIVTSAHFVVLCMAQLVSAGYHLGTKAKAARRQMTANPVHSRYCGHLSLHLLSLCAVWRDWCSFTIGKRSREDRRM